MSAPMDAGAVSITLRSLNEGGRDAFVAMLGAIYEHSPWVAERAWDAAPFASIEALHAAMRGAVGRAGLDAQLALIRAHPKLAGRAAIAGELTASSRSEQQGAGLDRCTPEEYARLHALNAAYEARFGFPFILAVAGRSRAEILAAFEARMANDPETEFATALREIDKIARLRLEAMERR